MSGAVDVARQICALIEPLGPDDMAPIRAMIAEAGIEPGMHVGDRTISDDPRRLAEWWLGQIADIIDREAWFAMNTALHVGADRFGGEAVSIDKAPFDPGKARAAAGYLDDVALVTQPATRPPRRPATPPPADPRLDNAWTVDAATDLIDHPPPKPRPGRPPKARP
jgi:hypothetical protein